MNLDSFLAHPIDTLEKYANLGAICLKDVSRFEDCDKVWAIVGVVLAMVAIIVLAFIARHFIREYAAHDRYRRKKLAEMEVAPEEVMNEHVWSGDKALEAGLTQEQMIQKIKEAKARQRMESEKTSGNATLGGGR